MTRLARGRDTHLVPEEIAVEALRQFDAGTEPSIRGLATALSVAPTAIYHHFPSRGAIVQAATDIVWAEIPAETVAILGGSPFELDPTEVLVASALATRHAFTRHHRIAPYMTATPQPDPIRAATLGVVGNVMERLGLHGEAAGTAWHSYATYTLGSTLFAAMRLTANEELGSGPDNLLARRFQTIHQPEMIALSSEETLSALDDVMDISVWDPVRDEELFVVGLRRVIASFLPEP